MLPGNMEHLPPKAPSTTLECFSHQPPGYDPGENDNIIYIHDLSDCTDDSDDSDDSNDYYDYGFEDGLYWT